MPTCLTAPTRFPPTSPLTPRRTSMPYGATPRRRLECLFRLPAQRRRMGANVRVNDLAGTIGGAPKIAVNASGNAYVVWQDSRNGHPDIYSAYRPANGSWGASRRINTDTGTAVQRDPAIGIDDAGIASIVWTDDRNSHDDIYFTSGTATGGWSPELRLNDDTSRPNKSPLTWPWTAPAM